MKWKEDLECYEDHDRYLTTVAASSAVGGLMVLQEVMALLVSTVLLAVGQRRSLRPQAVLKAMRRMSMMDSTR